MAAKSSPNGNNIHELIAACSTREHYGMFGARQLKCLIDKGYLRPYLRRCHLGGSPLSWKCEPAEQTGTVIAVYYSRFAAGQLGNKGVSHCESGADTSCRASDSIK